MAAAGRPVSSRTGHAVACIGPCASPSADGPLYALHSTYAAAGVAACADLLAGHTAVKASAEAAGLVTLLRVLSGTSPWQASRERQPTVMWLCKHSQYLGPLFCDAKLERIVSKAAQAEPLEACEAMDAVQKD